MRRRATAPSRRRAARAPALRSDCTLVTDPGAYCAARRRRRDRCGGESGPGMPAAQYAAGRKGSLSTDSVGVARCATPRRASARTMKGPGGLPPPGHRDVAERPTLITAALSGTSAAWDAPDTLSGATTITPSAGVLLISLFTVKAPRRRRSGHRRGGAEGNGRGERVERADAGHLRAEAVGTEVAHHDLKRGLAAVSPPAVPATKAAPAAAASSCRSAASP